MTVLARCGTVLAPERYFVLTLFRLFMSTSRQMIHREILVHPDLNLPEKTDHPAGVLAYAGHEAKGKRYGVHRHRRAQLFHIVSGSMTVETEHGSFVVPPERALWIPSNVEHAVTYHQRSSLR